MTGRALWRLLIAALMLVASPAVARDSLVVALQLEPPTLDPTSGASAAIDEVGYRTIFEGLTTLDATGAAVPLLAIRWEAAADLKSYVFHLRAGVRFHDGTPFDARIVAFSLMRAGGPASTNAQAEALGAIAGVNVIDPLTVRIRLRAPDAELPRLLALGDSVMVAPASAASLATRPIGTGPFRYDSWRRGDRLRLVRNPDYWGASPGLARLDFRFIADPAAAYAAMRGHTVDLFIDYPAPENIPALARDPSLRVSVAPTQGEVILALNNARAPLNDLRVRRAIALAIDRRAILDGAMFGYGTPIGSHFPPQDADHVDLVGRYPHDIAAARRLLAEAGYPSGLDLTLTLPPPSYARRSGEIVAAQLRAIGLRARIVPVEWAQWLDQVYGRHAFDMTIVAHVEPFDYAIYGRQEYYFGYDGAGVRGLLTALRTTADPVSRHALLGAIQRRIADDAVNAFLFEMPRLGVADARLSDFWANTPLQSVDYSRARFAGGNGGPDQGAGAGLPWRWLAAIGALAGLALLARALGPAWVAGRLAMLAASLVVASALIFVVLQVAPGDPAQFMMGLDASPRALAQLRGQLGLDGSAAARYGHWLAGLARGDLGLSYTYRIPVGELIGGALAVSLPLTGLALLLSVVIGVPGALMAARRPSGAADRAIGLVGELGLALPSFWLAMLLLIWTGGRFGGGGDAGLRALLLPALALGLPQAAVVLRVARAAIGGELARDYVRTARANGLGRGRVLIGHVLPNAAAPILAVIGLQAPFLLAGSVLVETVFALPGLGRLALQAVAGRDLITVQAVVMLLAAITILVGFAVDLAQALLDPRLRERR